MLAQLVEDLVHLERGEYGFDQDRGPDGATLDCQLVLGCDKDVVPEPRFEVTLELGQIKIRPAAARHQRLCVVEKIHREVEDSAGDRLAVDRDVLFGEVPPARPDKKRRGFFLELVALAFRGNEIDLAADGGAAIDMCLQSV